MSAPDALSAPATTVGWAARLLATVTAGYTAALLWATHYPKPQDFLGPNPPSDKLLHVSAYTVLGALVAATLAAAGRLSQRGVRAAAAALAGFAVLDEATQPLPWFRRAADPLDWLFDVAGIVIGIAAVVGARRAWRIVRGR